MRLKLALSIFITTILSAHVYGQYTLQDYIEIAQSNSPLIKDNQNQIQASTFEIQRLKALYTKFQLGISGNYLFAPIISVDNNTTRFEFNSAGADRYYGYDLAQTNGGLYQGLANFNQPLFNRGRFNAYAAQVEVSQQINENTIRLTKHDLEKTVTDQYILCLLDKKQVLYYDSVLVLLNDQLIIVRKLTEASLLKQSDLLLVNIELDNNKSLLASSRAAYRKDLYDLQILCGMRDTTFVILPDISLSLRGAVASSAYLEKFRLDSFNLMAVQKVFETKYIPQISLFSNAGLNAVYAPTMLNRFGFSAGLTASWELYDGHQKHLMANKTNIQLETISFYRENLMIQNAVRRNKVLEMLRANAERKAILQNQLSDYEKLLLTYKKEIMLGQLPIINYVMVLKNMIVVKRDYHVLEANDLLLINEYNYWNW